MKEFIEAVVKMLVDYPDEVAIREVGSQQISVFELRLNPSDVGKVIGKSGHTIMAIRTLLTNIGVKHNKRVMLEIIEPEHRAVAVA